MADDSNSAWNGLRRVWSSLKHKLLCHWHLKKAVREHCCGHLKKHKNVSVPKVTEHSINEHGIEITPDSFGDSVWELFEMMMRQTDESTFRRHLELMRSNLKAHGQTALLQYLERNYFTEDRIKQWAMWYRVEMYECEWILNTNNHVESWHNLLKSRILGRKKNNRIDSLLRALRQAEKMFIWKWLRVKSGYLMKCAPEWSKMLGFSETGAEQPETITPTLEAVPSSVESTNRDRKSSLVTRVMDQFVEIQSRIAEGCLPNTDTDSLKIILERLKSVIALFEAKPAPANLISTAIIPAPSRIPRVIEQYKFRKKKSRIIRNVTNVKHFRTNAAAQKTRLLSLTLSTRHDDQDLIPLMDFPETISTVCILQVLIHHTSVK